MENSSTVPPDDEVQNESNSDADTIVQPVSAWKTSGLVEDFLSFTLLKEYYDNDDDNNENSVNDTNNVKFRIHRPPGSVLDVLTIEENSNSSNTSTTTTRTIGLCNLATVSYFTYDKSDDDDDDDDTGGMYHRGIDTTSGYSSAFATYLAIQHLNNGDGSIVPELKGLNERCNIHFVPEFYDTGYSEPSRAIDSVEELLFRAKEKNTCPVSNTTTTNEQQFPEVLPPCGFIGSYISDITAITAAITGHEGYPQVSGFSTADELDDTNKYPLFGRTKAAQIGAAKAMVQYLLDDPTFLLDQPYLALVHMDNPIANQYVTRVRQVVDEYNVNATTVVYIESIPLDVSMVNVRSQMKKLKTLRFHTIFAILPYIGWDDFYDIIEEAYGQQMIGHGNTVWYFTEDSVAPIIAVADWPNYDVMYRSMDGIGMIWPGEGADSPLYLNFTTQLNETKQSVRDMEFLRAALPRTDGINETNLDEVLSSDEFLSPYVLDPRIQFVYEATIVSGLAACYAVTDDLRLNGTDFYTNLSSPSASFTSVSGRVSLDAETGTRSAETTFYTMLNFADQPWANFGQGGIAPWGTNVYSNGTWEILEDRVFQYNGGRFSRPSHESYEALLRSSPDPESVFVNTTVAAFSYLFLALALVVAIGCTGWTLYKRDTRIVRASQPVFLVIICFGTIVLATSIIPTTLDLRTLTITGLSRSCNAVVWLVAIGVSIIFSALASKTHRINVIMRNAKKCRRIKVSVKATLVPVIALVLANVLILACMLALDPITYKLEASSFDRFGRPKTYYGRCDVRWEYFIPLLLLNFAILAFAAVEAYLARNISTEFQESEHIYKALGGILLTSGIGIPVLFLVRDNPDSTVFVTSALVFVFCVSVLLNLFVPKIVFERKRLDQKNVHISGLSNRHDIPSVAVADGTAFPSISDDSASGERPNSSGDRILSTQTRQQLVEENAKLKMELALLKKKMTEEDVGGQVQESHVNSAA